MVTGDQILMHLIGDYATQSDWMASQKTQRSWPALCHATAYSAPFLLLNASLVAWLAILISHFFIDRYRLATYLVWLKNFLAPIGFNPPWETCKATGYPPEKPIWLSVWLLIILDNICHLCCNAIALRYL